MAKKLYTNGMVDPVFPRNGSVFHFEELKTMIGTHISSIKYDNRILIVNGLGHLSQLPKNHIASTLVEKSVFGDALLCDEKEVDNY